MVTWCVLALSADTQVDRYLDDHRPSTVTLQITHPVREFGTPRKYLITLIRKYAFTTILNNVQIVTHYISFFSFDQSFVHDVYTMMRQQTLAPCKLQLSCAKNM